MLAIRMQRTGRTGHASFRVVVQDSRQSPKSGKFVALLGSYDPHAKTTTLVKDKAEFYMKHGAQPSGRVASLFKQEGIKLPKWVVTGAKKKRAIRNPEKLRKNRTPEEVKPDAVPMAETTDTPPTEEPAPVQETPSEPTEEVSAEPKQPAESAADDTSA